ncbi:hypothetical protein QMO14_26975 [Variovorax sp. CAN2819]|uniref:hypothetical protein n=1 Tax=Variovorax sp. CAN15 TaxID=3046727 RepID=UPI0026486EE3|nr:hypothetical protein [Variovorax sp. CAN15]MDN6887231.1 hypothetical protein [Variovorax sp. CAN15]
MLTVIVLWLLAVAWLVANGMFAEKPSPQYRRRRSLLAWMFLGGCAGALGGLAGPAFSLPGAIFGAVAAGFVARSLVPLRKPDPGVETTTT